MEYLILILFALAMLPGIIGVIIPILPGVPYMFVLALAYGFIDHFQHLTAIDWLILGGLTVLSVIVDYFSGLLGAKYGGASAKSAMAGFAGLILGLVLFPPFGGIIGLFAGVLISELLLHNNRKKAFKAASGSLLGSLSGIIINLLISLLFLVLFIVFALK